jgi:nucleoside-diphosphate-sugar epimerase
VVNRLIQLALAGQALPIYGDGSQRRDYIHVDDVVSALVRLSESASSDDVAFNVGSGVGTRMIDMAESIVDLAGGGRIEHVAWPSLAEQIETGDFVADVSRIRVQLGWVPALSLRDGLRKTIAFYQARVTS